MPTSLTIRELDPFWATIRQRLDRHGTAWRGQVRRPTLAAPADLALRSLFGRIPPARLDLARLEERLVAVGAGGDLDDALARLGHPASVDSTRRRAERDRRTAVDVALRRGVEEWGRRWALEWVAEMTASGRLSKSSAAEIPDLVDGVDRVVTAVESLAAAEQVARNDLAARLFGSAHALDDDTLLERSARSALRHRGAVDPDVDPRATWAAVGVVVDAVSAPTLTLGLPLDPDSALGTITSAASALGEPIHLTRRAIERHGVVIVSGALSGSVVVRIVENPRVVEAAADETGPIPMIATNGNPTSATMRLVERLVAAGTVCRVHADFDAAGIGIVRRLVGVGCVPWRMDEADYCAAIDRARRGAISLPTLNGPVGRTPWSLGLEAAMGDADAAVHEEFVLDDLLR